MLLAPAPDAVMRTSKRAQVESGSFVVSVPRTVAPFAVQATYIVLPATFWR